MKLELIIGRSKTGKSTYIYDQIRARLENDNSENLVLVVPEQTTYSSEYDVIERLNYSGIMEVEILSFKRLAYKIFEEVGSLKIQEINDYGKIMLLKQIFDKHINELQVYKKASKKEGFLKEFNNLIKELKENNVNPEFLKKITEYSINDEVLKRKIFDITCIYENIENKINGKYFDTEDKAGLFIELMDNSYYLKNSSFWIDNFDSFTGQRYKIIEKLIKISSKVTIVLNLDCNSLKNLELIDDWESFKTTHDTYKKLKEISENTGAELIITPLNNRHNSNKELNFLERNMFTINLEQFSEKNENIFIYSAMNPYTESEITARKIIHLVRENNYRWKDITIAVSDMDKYSINIKKVFSQYGIPYYLDIKRNIIDNVLPKFVLSILDMFIWNFKYENVFEYLKSGFVDFDKNDIDKLENFAIQYGIERTQWFDKFEFRADDIEYYENLREKFSGKFKNLRKEFSTLRNVEDITAFLFNILKTHNVQDKMENWVDDLKSKGLYETAYINTQIWNIVMELFDQIIASASEVEITPDQYKKILEAGFKEIEIGIIPPTIDKVGIGGIDRASTKKSKILFVMGTNEGMLPALGSDKGILLDEEKDVLSKLGVNFLSGSSYSTYKEKHTIYKAFSKPDDKIYFSYSLSTVEGRALQPSIYIDRLKTIFPNIKVESEISDVNDINYVSTVNGTLNYAVERIRENAEGQQINNIWKDVYGWFDRNTPQIKQIVENGIQYNNKNEKISEDNVFKIYKIPLTLSASKLESYVECPFKFFVQAGLKPKPRKENKVEYYDIGDIFHKSVEEFTNKITEEKLDFSQLDKNEVYEIMSQSVDKILQEKKSENNALEANARNRYMKNKIKRLGNRAAWTIVKQVRKGSFRPEYNELKFSEAKEENLLNPIEIKLKNGSIIYLIGRVDRVDVLKKEKNTYVNIIDYKSGSKDLDISDVINGLQLQLFIYLDAVLKNGEKLFKNKPEIGGVFYFNIDDPMLDGDCTSPDNVEEEIFRKLSLKGYSVENIEILKAIDEEILDNRASDIIPVKLNRNDSISKTSKTLEKEIYEKMLEKVENIVFKISEDILNGIIDIRPYKKNDFTPCVYCEYKSICQYDISVDGNKYRKINKFSKDEIVNQLTILKEGENK